MKVIFLVYLFKIFLIKFAELTSVAFVKTKIVFANKKFGIDIVWKMFLNINIYINEISFTDFWKEIKEKTGQQENVQTKREAHIEDRFLKIDIISQNSF